MPREEIETFLTALPEAVSDPITGYRPSREVELSAILASYHQRRRIDWQKAKINIWSADGNNFIDDYNISLPLSTVLQEHGRTLTEYPLFAETEKQWNRWGEMSADVFFVTDETARVVLFESKLDSKFTYADYPPDGQLSRLIEYLSHLPQQFEQRFLMLLFPKTNSDWYIKRLQEAANKHKDNRICIGYATWEDVFEAVTTND